LASKHGEQLLNEIFIFSKEIAPTPGHLRETWGFFKMTTVQALEKKCFQEFVFKALERLRSYDGDAKENVD